MNHKNDCAISMAEFKGSPFADATLKEMLRILEISVTPEDGPRKLKISYPEPGRYAERRELLIALLEEMEADFEQ